MLFTCSLETYYKAIYYRRVAAITNLFHLSGTLLFGIVVQINTETMCGSEYAISSSTNIGTALWCNVVMIFSLLLFYMLTLKYFQSY